MSCNELNMHSLKLIFSFILTISLSFNYAQEIPPIESFMPQDYNAGNQNWSIGQDSNENIYVANNKGLLEYNGARWSLYKMPNQAIIRSVAVIDDLVYTGSYMNFGYWEPNSYGALVYKSLLEDLSEELLEDEEFWNIISFEEFVLFQSLDRIYIYNTSESSFRVIDSKSKIIKVYKVDESVFFQERGIGISKIENGRPILLIEDTIIKDNEIINIFEGDDGFLLFQTKEYGFFKFKNSTINKWEISSNELLDSVSVYNSIRLRNGNFILGTISNGVIILDKKGDLLFQINKNSGLSNNTVLSSFQDISGNIWLGLDNGVDIINLGSPYRVYTDSQGYLGTIYTSEKTNKNLYLGTNQGLFYKPLNSTKKFELISGTKGQVWFLKQINGTLFCGHDKGSFEIKDNIATLFSTEEGVWSIKKIPGDNRLIQGHYNGLSIIKKEPSGDWTLDYKIKGFDISSRYFEFTSYNKILVSHEYKGVYKLNLDNELRNVITYDKLNIGKSIGSSLISYKDVVLYNYDEGLFSFNKTQESFEKNIFFNELFSNSSYVSGKLVYHQKTDRLWGFLKEQLVYIEPGKLSDIPIVNTIDLPNNLRKDKAGFENILYIDDNKHLLGTTDGYLIIDLEKFVNKEYYISINNVSFSTLQRQLRLIDISKQVALKNSENNLHFNFSVADYDKLSPSSYQYRLIGLYDDWSQWSAESSAVFENLPHGRYVFEVRAKVGSSVSVNTAKFNFDIEKPWYLKPLAILGYVLLFFIIAALIQYANRIYYKKQKKALLQSKERELEIRDLENQRQLMEFKNQSLQQDIENKSRELGLSTMTLIRKNEFLNTLKKELNALEKGNELNKIIRIIDKNINNTEDWKFFEEAFNNADKDFLKKVKKKHPSLTPNDLKLCAYLRLNLSSKEIAPLLNISHRSVEVKRYRLRKKMELPHEASLTNYILEI